MAFKNIIALLKFFHPLILSRCNIAEMADTVIICPEIDISMDRSAGKMNQKKAD
jgi:hypothetical protein